MSFGMCENQHPPKTPQNLKNRGPDRPKVDFGMTFGIHLGMDFHEILDFIIICENHRNAYIQSISVDTKTLDFGILCRTWDGLWA